MTRICQLLGGVHHLPSDPRRQRFLPTTLPGSKSGVFTRLNVFSRQQHPLRQHRRRVPDYDSRKHYVCPGTQASILFQSNAHGASRPRKAGRTINKNPSGTEPATQTKKTEADTVKLNQVDKDLMRIDTTPPPILDRTHNVYSKIIKTEGKNIFGSHR